jgi:hypothetical protein
MSAAVAEQPFEVLLAEDHPGDVKLTREALKGSAVRINLSVAANGEETLAFSTPAGKVHRGSPSINDSAGSEHA